MDLQTLLLAVVALVLFRLAVDEGEMLQLYSLSFSSPYVKEGVTGKSPLLSRTPSQVRSAVVLHLVHPSISAPLHDSLFPLFILIVFFSAFSIVFLSCDTTFLSCAIAFCSYFCVVKFYTVVPWKFWIFNCLLFLKSLHFFGHSVINWKHSSTICCVDLHYHWCLSSWIRICNQEETFVCFLILYHIFVHNWYVFLYFPESVAATPCLKSCGPFSPQSSDSSTHSSLYMESSEWTPHSWINDVMLSVY